MLSQEQINALLGLVDRAGQATLPYWRQELAVAHKEDDSPVTAADLAAHRVLADGLTEILAVPLLSEEDCNIALQERAAWQRWWLVDPLDGTKEFIAGSPEYTVNVALIEAGRVLFGVVGVPAADCIYYGGKGMGAWLQEAAGHSKAIRVAKAGQVLRVAGSRSHGSAAQTGFVERLQQDRTVEMQTAGSSLKFCWLAEGRIDLYPRLSPTSQWDTAAAQAVLEGAGGQVLDWQGRPLTYEARESYFNPDFVALPDDPGLLENVLAAASHIG